MPIINQILTSNNIFKTKKLLVNDNYKLIEKHDFFEELCKLMVTNLVGWGGFVWNVIGSRNTCYN
jgi:hypothetical protein